MRCGLMRNYLQVLSGFLLLQLVIDNVSKWKWWLSWVASNNTYIQLATNKHKYASHVLHSGTLWGIQTRGTVVVRYAIPWFAFSFDLLIVLQHEWHNLFGVTPSTMVTSVLNKSFIIPNCLSSTLWEFFIIILPQTEHSRSIASPCVCIDTILSKKWSGSNGTTVP